MNPNDDATKSFQRGLIRVLAAYLRGKLAEGGGSFDPVQFIAEIEGMADAMMPAPHPDWECEMIENTPDRLRLEVWRKVKRRKARPKK